MSELIKNLIETISIKLVLRPKAVKKWVKFNNYNENQLITICKQITYNEINLPNLVNSIIYNSKYRISI